MSMRILLNNNPAMKRLSPALTSAGLVVTAAVCLIVALSLLWSGIRSSQLQMLAAQNGDSRRQNLVHLVSSIDLNHHRFLRSTSQFVHGSGLVSREEARWRLQHYASQFAELRTVLGAIESEIALAQTKGSALESYDGEVSLAKNQRVRHIISGLLRDGEATLTYVDTLISWLNPGDSDGYNDILNIMDLLGDDITALEMAAQQRRELLDEKALENRALLAGKLATARYSMGLGLIMLFALAFLFARHRHIAANNLRQSNEKLQSQIEASRQLTEELRYRATHDALSGLCNRSGFNSTLQDVLDRGIGYHGLCFIDLDMFKIVNDTSGHAAGDQLILEVARLIEAESPEGSLVARFGGDEFLVLVKDCNEIEFKRAMAHCCYALRTLAFSFAGRRFSISGSFGALHFNAKTHDIDTLMNIVDTACYEAKNDGGGRMTFRTGSTDAVELRRDDHVWVNRIQSALENDRFCLYYQPIASISKSSSKPIHSWELLLRMIDDNGEVVAPGKFLDIAEQYSLAPRIDSWVINRTFAWLESRGGRMEEVDCINVNLSGRSVGNADLLKLIRQHADAFEGDLSIICFEITETAIVGNNAREFLTSLKAMGFRIALDDFGSGFSSFGYLESLPVDYIKIDGIFVRDIDSNPTHQEFVKAINAVGKAMEKLTVAEFVENSESLSILHELGVDYAQGFYLAHPAPLPEAVVDVTDLLDKAA